MRPGNTLGKNAKLFTYYVVREDAAELYGFFSERERDLFKLLIGISGVGPKAALAVLSVALAGRFCRGGRLPGRTSYFRCPRRRTQSAQKTFWSLKTSLPIGAR